MEKTKRSIFKGSDAASRGVDLSVVSVITAQLTEAPTLDQAKGMLHLKGYFPGQPVQINFEMLYQVVEGRWRLFGISVNPSQRGHRLPLSRACLAENDLHRPVSLPEAFIKEARAAGMPITFHGLRHSHITHLLRAGVPVHIVSARAGHARPSITLDSYSHLLGGDDEKAAELADAMLRRALK